MEQPEQDNSQQIRVLEAMLFASAEPLTLNTMRERLPENADLGGMLMELQQFYDGKGVNLIEVDGSWAFRTAQDLADSLTIEKDVQRKLSRAAMETMAIIAYHQPITRAEIENIRGVATHRGTLDVLVEAGWVKPGRRRETPGRPLTWVTTTSFLDHFGLEAITDLPGLDELKASGLLDRRPAIEALPETAELFDEEEVASSDEDGEEFDGDGADALNEEFDSEGENAAEDAAADDAGEESAEGDGHFVEAEEEILEAGENTEPETDEAHDEDVFTDTDDEFFEEKEID